MPFGLNFSSMVPDLKTKLPEQVTNAIAGSPPSDKETIQLMGQVLHHQLKKMKDTEFVDVNINGATDNVTGNKSLTMSIRTRDTAPTTTQAQKAWTPDQGPIIFKDQDTGTDTNPTPDTPPVE